VVVTCARNGASARPWHPHLHD